MVCERRSGWGGARVGGARVVGGWVRAKTGAAGAACFLWNMFGTTGHILVATVACHVESECLSRVPSALRPFLRVRESQLPR